MNAFFLILYLLFQIGIGVYVSKFIKNEDDYFLGGRNVPLFALSFSIFATWFGAETCIGSSAAVFAKGLSGSKAEPFGYGLCLLLVGMVVAPRIYNNRYTTLGDFFKDKFGSMAEKFAIWVLLPSSIFWAAAQIKAFGQVLSTVTDLQINLAIFLATLFVVIYTLLGGLLGDIITDVIQGIILGICLLLIAYFAIDNIGGVKEAFQIIDSKKLNFLSEEESLLAQIDNWLIPILGSLIAQEMIARILAAKGKKVAVGSAYTGFFLYMFFGSIPIFLGLIGHHFNLSLGESEEFLPELAKAVLPHYLFLLFGGAIISAILSTIDSILLAISALLTHNFLIPTLNITSERKKIATARLVVIATAVLAYILAIFSGKIYDLVETASSFGTSGILIVTIWGLFLKNKRDQKIIVPVILIFGIIVSILFEWFIEVEAPFLYNLVMTSFLLIGLYLFQKRTKFI